MAAIQKRQQQAMVVAALAGVFALVLLNSLRTLGLFGGRSHAKAPQPSAAQTRPEPAQPTQDAAEADAPTQTDAGYAAHALRDPFADLLPNPPATTRPSTASAVAQAIVRPVTPPPLPSFAVQGMWWGESGASAIINGKLCRVGDEINGAVVKAVTGSGVVVEFAGETIELTIAHSTERSGFSRRMR